MIIDGIFLACLAHSLKIHLFHLKYVLQKAEKLQAEAIPPPALATPIRSLTPPIPEYHNVQSPFPLITVGIHYHNND